MEGDIANPLLVDEYGLKGFVLESELLSTEETAPPKKIFPLLN